MLGWLEKLLPTLGGLVYAGLTYGLFHYLNGTINEDLRLRISLWIYGDRQKLERPFLILPIFEAFFGKKAFSWKALVRVLLLEAAVTPLIMLATGSADLTSFEGLGLGLVLISPITGFFSVLKTRLLLKWSIGKPRWWTPILLLVDILAGLAVGFLVAVAYGNVVKIIYKDVDVANQIFSLAPITDTDFDALNQIFSLTLADVVICLGMPFVHSLWMLLAIVSAFCTRLAIHPGAGIPTIAKFLSNERIDKEPLTLFGEIGAGFVVAFSFVILMWSR